MTRTARDIMLEHFPRVGALRGIRELGDLAGSSDLDVFPVVDEGVIIGALTLKDMVRTHPNRIVADAMSGVVGKVSESEYLWKIQRAIDELNVDLFLVRRDEQVTGIITKQMLRQEMRMHLDPLTGLYKGGVILYNVIDLIEKHEEISVMFFDINDFGVINKSNGHMVGDSILRELSGVFKSNVPQGASLCRYGGDEFAVAVPLSLGETREQASYILDRIKSYKFLYGVPVSVSAGISGGRRGLLRHGDPMDVVRKLINLASLASTRAKSENGNIWVHDGDLSAAIV